MFDRAAGMGDLIGAHRCVADQHQFVIVAVFVEYIPHRRALGEAAAVVPPYALVGAVVEIEEFEILELARRRREQFLAELDERIHRATDVEEQQQLDRIMPLRPHADVEPALPRGAFDRGIEIELIGSAFAGEAAQAAQRELDIACTELTRAVQVSEFALVPHLERALVDALATDADAFGVVARIAERAGAAGADPLVAALVTALLLGEALLERFHDLVPRTERPDLLHFLWRQ